MEYTKNDLNKRICDLHEGTENTQTLKEFIRESEDEFGMDNENLEEISDKDLNEYIDFLEYLWGK